MKRRAEPAVSLDGERRWHVGRCPRCRIARSAVEVGQGDKRGRDEIVSAGYVVSIEAGPVQFRPHEEGCPWPKN